MSNQFFVDLAVHVGFGAFADKPLYFIDQWPGATVGGGGGGRCSDPIKGTYALFLADNQK